jgi:glutamyl-tRNA synthetase
VTVRCRFAPAPSGFLHVGGARTALFNWLFARHHGGVFVLRIEDTDPTRVTPEAIESLKDALQWLGIEWDEGPDVGGPFGPYRQTERLEMYRDVAADLQRRDRAYRCYCTPEELEERRKAAQARGEPPGYDGRCRNLSDEERRVFEAEGRPFAIRFATPGHEVVVHDVIRGDAHFGSSDLKDFVILRSDETPTYLLAAAVDDIRMQMTHVIRGEDLFPSTPRQILIFEALGMDPPRYAHLPLIVGPDRKPLSKRHGAVAVEWFRDQGYLAEALVNYLALLGWSYDEHSELFTRDELTRHFDLDRVSHNPAQFDDKKVLWMNGHYIREVSDDELTERVMPFLREAGLEADAASVRRAVPHVKERIHTLREAVDMLRFLFTDDLAPDEKAAKLLGSTDPEHLKEAASRLEAVEDWTDEEITRVLEEFAQDVNLSKTKAWQPIRAAVTGTTISPPLPESLGVLGRGRTLERLRNAASLFARTLDPST